MATSYSMHKTTTFTSSSHHEHGSAGYVAEEFVAAAEREKREMQGLNDRLEVYIGRVKQLEEKNRTLVVELDTIRGSLGGEVGQIKYKFNDSLTKVRKEIAEASSGTIGIEVRVNRLRDDLSDYRNRYEEARREVEREKTTWGGSIAQASAELERNKSRYAAILDEEKRLYAEQDGLYAQLSSAKDELDAAIAERLRLQQQEEALKTELEFLGRVHAQEITELRGLLTQAPADTREFFKNELAEAIREIKAEYEKIIQTTKVDLEVIFQTKVSAVEAAVVNKNEATLYRQEEIRKMNESISSLRVKLGELESKNAHLEREANSLQMQLSEDQRAYESELIKRDNALRFMREDCQTLIAELQALLNTKQTLDTEIAIYRKLVESEEHRSEAALPRSPYSPGDYYHRGEQRQSEQQQHHHADSGSSAQIHIGRPIQAHESAEYHQQYQGGGSPSHRVGKFEVEKEDWASGEVAVKSTFKRHAKGNVSIIECDPNGKYVILENTSGAVAEDVSHFQIRRILDGVNAFTYTLPSHSIIHPHGHIKIYGRSAGGHHSPPESIVMESHPSWGTGTVVQTTLYNQSGIEKASHIQTVEGR